MFRSLAAVTVAWAGSVAAQEPCDNGMVSVVSAQPALVGQVCSAADRAISIFSECDVGLAEPVTVHTEDEIVGGCLGLYHCGASRIDVLTPEAISARLKPDGLYAKIPVHEMFESVVIHEMTHALYESAPCPSDYNSCLVTSEYLAYAVQFDALSGDARAAWNDRIDAGETVGRDAIGFAVLMMDVDRFALNSWLHFNQREDRCGWIKGILDGAILFDRPRP